MTPEKAKATVLYLSYDGMTDPLGGSQVLPYLVGLARRGHRITLISFEKPERSSAERRAVEELCQRSGIDWHPLAYHKRPPVLSTVYDLRRMRQLATRLHKQRHFDIVHCRSYIPALVGLGLKRRFGVRFLFDMRGFWADERVEGGQWDLANPLFKRVYRYFKRREMEFWRESDAIVSLTAAARKIVEAADSQLTRAPPITVIPCCVDFDLFRPVTSDARTSARERLGIGGQEPVLCYLGSLGGNYMLAEMLDFYRAFRERHGRAKFLFITHTTEREIDAAAATKGIPTDEILVRKASRSEVADLVAAADAGIAFKQPTFSATACSPTKIGEMLALELPVVTNTGVGDVDQLIQSTGGGVLVTSFETSAYRGAVDQLERLQPDVGRWRETTRRSLDLDRAVGQYDSIYAALCDRSLSR